MTDLTGQSIGKYKILKPLGEGGMAVVYQGFDPNLEREVAIKFIRRGAFPPEILQSMLQRFEREAKALAKLSHPNIVTILDYGEYQGAPYLVMEYVSGGTLKQRLGTPMSYTQAARLLAPVARALEYAHQHQIIHRDVKPANILITDSQVALLSDFGIAKMLEGGDATSLTASGSAIGTPEYMAPEQALSKEIDGQVDVYSLGVVFYELVTGRKPYTADTPMGVLVKHIHDPLPRPRQFAPELPEPAEFMVMKALAKDPRQRFKDMSEFAMVLEKLAAGLLPHRVPDGPGPRRNSPKAQAKIPPWVWATLGLAAVGVIALLVLLIP